MHRAYSFSRGDFDVVAGPRLELGDRGYEPRLIA
jgi:hypothetical protein